MLRILVIDGNPRWINEEHIAAGGIPTGEFYAQALRKIYSDLTTEIIHPADDRGAMNVGLEDFDGLMWTGSALHANRFEREVRAQVELARQTFQTQVPVFGSCWGLQVTTMAAGGFVAGSRNGRELPVARDISVTEAGLTHPMFTGKPPLFDAITSHLDEVIFKPPGMRVLASSLHSPVQAAEIPLGGGFWGTQYHPEYDFREIAIVIRRYAKQLQEDLTYVSPAAQIRASRELTELNEHPDRIDIAKRWGFSSPTVLDPANRSREILNWLTLKVAPAASTRTRA